jgi:HK97 family phage major capsid protein
MTPSNQCVVEMRERNFLAKSFLEKGNTVEARKLQRQAEELGNLGLSSSELRQKYCAGLIEMTQTRKDIEPVEYRNHFDGYVSGRIADGEMRDWLSGTQSITYTQGVQGGYLVPLQYDDTLREAMSQTDPVLDATVTDFTMTSGPFLQPPQISGYDDSSIIASLIGESVQQNPQAIATVLGATLRADRIFKASFAASWEAETDVPSFAEKVIRSSAIALARRVGQSVLSGRGGVDISGIVQALGSPSLSNSTTGKLTLADINGFYFGVNRWHRAQPKCGWLVNDGAYKYLRAATDNSGRPLLSVERDGETLLGKRVYICPSLATAYSSIGLEGAIIFGNLASIVVRASRMQVQRSIQQGQADITKGEALYIGRWRVDATYFDASSGLIPPVALCSIS